MRRKKKTTSISDDHKHNKSINYTQITDVTFSSSNKDVNHVVTIECLTVPCE